MEQLQQVVASMHEVMARVEEHLQYLKQQQQQPMGSIGDFLIEWGLRMKGQIGEVQVVNAVCEVDAG